MTTYVLGTGRNMHQYSLFPIELLDGYAENGVLSRIRALGTFDAPTWNDAMQMFHDHQGYGVYKPIGGPL